MEINAEIEKDKLRIQERIELERQKRRKSNTRVGRLK